MRVLTFITRFLGLKSTSLEAQISEEYSRLSQCLDELTVVTEEGKPKDKIKIHKIHPIHIPKIYGLTKTLLFLLAPLRRRKQVDRVYVRTFSPPELTALWASKSLAGLPAVLLIAGTWLFEPKTLKNIIFRWILRRAVSASDRVILYSPLMLKDVKKYVPNLGESKVRYIHNAVDIDRFKPGEKPPINNLLYVGRVNEKKGVEDLIYAMKSLVPKFPNVKLFIVGSDPTGGAYIEQLKKLASKLGFANSVFFVGPIPNKDIPSYYQKASVFLFASHGGEGIPRSILEAMACGVPVVATKIAGTPEAVKDGETGFLIPPRNPKLIAKKTAVILKDQDLRAKMGKNARKKIEEEFSWEKVIPQLVKTLKEGASTKRILKHLRN